MLSPNQTNMVVLEEKDQEEEEPIVAHEQVATSSNDPINTSIIKGKRTKRQRPQSPISFCLNLNTDDNNDNDNINTLESEESRSDICINIQDTNTNANTSVMFSDDSHTYKSKVDEEEGEEEYDIANCLILLAQGLPRYLCETSNNDDPYYKPPPSDQKKFTSKKFMETPHGDKAGYYVYECKTCFKTFPSFQALGGHRASHMKPKKEEERTNNLTLNDVQCLNAYNDNHYTNNNTNPNLFNNANNKKPRIHECSTCGAEFLSGQALGGHMRRHRAPVGGARIDNINGGFRHNHSENYFPHEMPSSLSFNNTMMANTANVVEDNIGKPPLLMEAKKLYLNLDLNLAAPVEDESSKIHSASKE